MKYFLLLSLSMLACLPCSHAQQQTALFEGRIYNVFPFKIEAYTDNSDEGRELGIYRPVDAPWFPGSLPNGDYIAYYEPFDYAADGSGNFVADTSVPAITFSIRENKKEGPVVFYDPAGKGRAYLEGRYTGDLKDGLWKFIPENNKLKKKPFTRSRNTPDIYSAYRDMNEDYNSYDYECEISFEYKNGLLNGMYTRYDAHTAMTIKGSYANGEKEGTWQWFQKDKLFQSYTYQAGIPSGDFQYVTADGHVLKGYLKDNNIEGTWELRDKKGVLRERHIIENAIGEPDKDSGYYYEKEKYEYTYGIYCNWNDPKNVIVEDYDEKGRLKYSNRIYYGMMRHNTYTLGNLSLLLKQVHPVLGAIYEYNDTETKRLYAVKDFIRTELFEENRIIKENRLSSKTISKEWYLLENREVPELLLTDSFIYYNEGATYTILNYLHVLTGKILTRSYNDMKNGRRQVVTDFQLETLQDRIIVTTLATLDKLTISDTFHYPLVKDAAITSSEFDNLLMLNNFIGQRLQGYRHQPYYALPDIHKGKVFWEGIPYEGPLNIIYTSTEKEQEPEVSYLVHRYLDGTEESHEILITLGSDVRKWTYSDHHYENTMYSKKPKRKIRKAIEEKQVSFITRYFPKSKSFYFRNGKFDSKVSFTNAAGRTLYEAEFLDGYKHGTEMIVDVYRKDDVLGNYFIPRKEEKDDLYNECVRLFNYKRSMLDGSVLYYANETHLPQSLIHYKNGMLHGENQYFFNSGRVRMTAGFKNDTLDGSIKQYNNNGMLLSEIPFRKGLLHGHMRFYIADYESMLSGMSVSLSPDQDIDPFADPKQVLVADIPFKDGMLCDTARYYFSDGLLKARVIYHPEDSVKIADFKKQGMNAGNYSYPEKKHEEDTVLITDEALLIPYESSVEEYIPSVLNYSQDEIYINIPEEDLSLDGSYEYFYKSGVRSQKGEVKNSKKSGTWLYWNESGNLMKEIEYVKGITINPADGDSIYYTGRIKLYYPAGSFMGEGYVTDESFSYECVQDADISYQDVFYTRFLDRDGKDIYKNYSGPVQDFHLNGNKRCEGQVEKGKRTGTWKSYEPDGKLREIGNYVNGKKDGRWLQGDLSGINYIDNQCYSNDQMFEIQTMLMARELSFSESIWQDGELIKEVSYNLKKD